MFLADQETISLVNERLLENEEREEEGGMAFSTKLTLFTDPWTIKKEQIISDEPSLLILKR